MASAPSPSAPKNIGEQDKPYAVRVEVCDENDGSIFLSKNIEHFAKMGDAVTFAQRVWRKFAR